MRRRSAAIGTFYLALTAAFAAPLFVVPNGTGWLDWDFNLSLHAAVLKSLVEYGQLPFWNPWVCGGNVLLANPQVPLLSPTYLLASVLSLPLAMKINIVVHYWVALVGMHLLLTRIIGLRFLPGVLFLASAFAFSGSMAMHLAYGHATFLPALYLPLLLYFFCLALERGAVKYAVISGAILALMVFSGGVHIVPMAAAIVGLPGLVSSLVRRDWRPLGMAAIVGIAGALFAAPKIVPIVLFLTSPEYVDTRIVAHPDLMTVEMLIRSLIDPYQHRGLGFDGQLYSWIEYGNYVGLPLVLATAASVAWIVGDRRIVNRWFGVSLAVTTMALVALMAGEFSSWAPASLMAHVPLFSRFRVPSRYTIVAVLSAVMTVAWAARTLELEALVPKARIAVTVLCLLLSADIFLRNRRMLGGAFVQDPVDASFHLLGGPTTLVTDADSKPFQWGSPMLRTIMKGESFFRCYEAMRVAPNADTVHPLIWLDGDARIFTTSFSPNRTLFSVSGGREPSRVRLNQNFAKGWRSDAGVVEPDPETGQPSVVLGPGQTGTFSFVFVPPGLFLGCGLWLVAIGASAFGWRRSLNPSATPRGWLPAAKDI
ncbi:MAG: hypothetical protein ND807_08250 [Vicinamibacterales bacterium]|nr:hypothetical protein [Vicinamibacterales bacterium]